MVNKLISLSAPSVICCPNIDTNIVRLATKNWPKYEIDWTTKLSQNLDENNEMIEIAQNVWKISFTDSERSASDWWFIYNRIISEKSRHLIDAGMFPRSVPATVLPQLIADNTDARLKMIIGACAISIANEQRFNRISTYWQKSHKESTLEREIENTPYENWKPNEYPEWLLFEIEQNVTIRRIQIEIAKRMIDDNPSERNMKHFTMQFNMGEGKTAVVVPILASVLANGLQVCQITILKSLFATNSKSLRQYLSKSLLISMSS